jgi:hypothetical protein
MEIVAASRGSWFAATDSEAAMGALQPRIKANADKNWVLGIIPFQSLRDEWLKLRLNLIPPP